MERTLKQTIWDQHELRRTLASCLAVMQAEKAARILSFLQVWRWQGAPAAGELDRFCNAALRYAGPDAFQRSVVHLDMGKSNLLYRVLVLRQPIRTQPCPTHQGTWSGLDFGENTHGFPHCVCGLTGWLPE